MESDFSSPASSAPQSPPSEVDDHLLSDDSLHSPKRKKSKKNGMISGLLKGKSGGYAWEDQIHRSWDVVVEGADGTLQSAVQNLVEASKRKRVMKDATPFQRGIIRSVVLVLDWSRAMAEKDFRPSRAGLAAQLAGDFVTQFFEENPILLLGIVGMRNGVAQVVSPYGSDPAAHRSAIRRFAAMVTPEGDPLLQNALEMARGMLALSQAGHVTREVVAVFGALFTADPGDIFKTIKQLVTEKIRVRVVGLSAEVHICKRLVAETNYGELKGLYSVALNEQHFLELLSECVAPLAAVKEAATSASLVRMGFPQRMAESVPSFCSCHLEVNYGGYKCPECKSKVCSLPGVCPTCNLMLISSTHLARLYHHLFPLENYTEVKFEECLIEGTLEGPFEARFKLSKCVGCMMEFGVQDGLIDPKVVKGTGRFRCGGCGGEFCIDCNVFVHEELHNCPGC